MENRWIIEGKVKKLEAELKSLKAKLRKAPRIVRGHIHSWRHDAEEWIFDWSCAVGDTFKEKSESLHDQLANQFGFDDLVFGVGVERLICNAFKIDSKIKSEVAPALVAELNEGNIWYDVLYPKDQILLNVNGGKNKIINIVGYTG